MILVLAIFALFLIIGLLGMYSFVKGLNKPVKGNPANPMSIGKDTNLTGTVLPLIRF